MCTILLNYQPGSAVPLMIAGNRDEFYQRPTRGLHWWEDQPDLLGGKDLQAGGTWLGITRSGRFATLTNYREVPPLPGERPSRGELVRNFLEKDMPAEDYLEWLKKEGQQYQGFNLLFGHPEKLFYYSNRTENSGPLTPGFHGLSNHLLNTQWPKVADGLASFKTLAQTKQAVPTAAQIFELLYNPATYPDDRLPATGVELVVERMVSALFIESPAYGTRVSWFLTVDDGGKVAISEKGYIPESNAAHDFQIQQLGQ